MAPPDCPLAIRGSVLHFPSSTIVATEPEPEYFDDGLLVVRDGHVAACGPAGTLLPDLPDDTPIEDWRGRLIVPGFVDTHVHYAQTDIIASPGEELSGWLERYAFPAEQRLADPVLAAETAGFFCEELLRNGTTTALTFATVHPGTVDALFAAASQRTMRLIAGKVLMDLNCPDGLRETARTGDEDTRALIERWHGHGRLRYAVTPRFALTSSPTQMRLAGRLFAEYPDLYLHSHLAENRSETTLATRYHPEARSYLDVLDRHGQLGPRAVFAHCIWLDDADRRRMAGTGTAIAFCPTSNLFLGSGLFDLERADAHGIRVGIGTDVGAGTSFSILQTLNEAYKVLRLQGQVLSAERAFHLATLGGARSLYLDDRIGNFEPGKEADFIVLDPRATPLLARRTSRTASLSERLFAFMMLGDDRAVAATYVLGRCAWRRPD